VATFDAAHWEALWTANRTTIKPSFDAAYRTTVRTALYSA
jgi:hypothetical protein